MPKIELQALSLEYIATSVSRSSYVYSRSQDGAARSRPKSCQEPPDRYHVSKPNTTTEDRWMSVPTDSDRQTATDRRTEPGMISTAPDADKW